MLQLSAREPLVVAVVRAIRGGDLPTLKRLPAENPDLATATITEDGPNAGTRLLHVATDWPGHFPIMPLR